MRRSFSAWMIVAGGVWSMIAPMSAQERETIDVASLGPQVGEQIPAFALPDQHGRVQTLESIVGEQGAMIVFHRSADW